MFWGSSLYKKVKSKNTIRWECAKHAGLWRKIKKIWALSENVKRFCGMLNGLALLPLDDVSTGMQYLRDNTPEGLEDLIVYYDSTYVSGTYRRIQPPANDPDGPLPPVVLCHWPPTFPPHVWNVFQITVDGGDCTNNLCKGWNNSFCTLIGHKHPSIWTLIAGLQQDQAMVVTYVVQDNIGDCPHKWCRRSDKTFNECLKNLCNYRL